jgi:CBS-domain-containing membrane protein
MNAADVMTRDLVVIGPDTMVRDIARLLVQHWISAVPVVDREAKVIGIVSEGDLLRRGEIGTAKPRRRWLNFFADRSGLAEDYVKAHGAKAADVMTPSPVVVAPETPISDVAELLEKNRIKRAPVVENGKLVGIVSRSNLVQALASAPAPAAAVATDRAIREALMAELKDQPWSRRAERNIVVAGGVVHLWGVVDSEPERQALRIAAERIPGVRGVENHLSVMPIVAFPF